MKSRTLVLLGVILTLSLEVHSQDIDAYMDKLSAISPTSMKLIANRSDLDKCTKDSKEDIEELWKLLTAVQKESQFQQKLQGEASLSFQGDEVDSNAISAADLNSADQYKFGVGLKMSRGTYPGEFEFATAVDLRLQDGKFKEDVTKIESSYDYYTEPWFEGFVFGSRFSDSFLNIDQRYEVGFGAFAGRTFKPFKQIELPSEPSTPSSTLSEPELRKVLDKIAPADDTTPKDWYLCYEQIREKTGETKKIDDISKFQKDLRSLFYDVEVAQKKRYSRFRLGVSAAILSEFEKATIKRTRQATVPDLSGGTRDIPIEDSFPLDSEQRYRVSLRPTFEWQPSFHWKFLLHWYWKFPLGDIRTSKLLPGGTLEEVLDYRSDLDANLNFKVNANEIGQPGDVTITLQYRRFFDNAPPLKALTGPDLGTFLTAPDTHQILSLKLTVKWK